MALAIKTNERNGILSRARTGLKIFVIMLSLSGTSFAASAPQQKTFPSAADAVKAAISAARSNDDKELLTILGAQAKDLISSGDAVADKQRRAQFIKAFDEKNRLVVEEIGRAHV